MLGNPGGFQRAGRLQGIELSEIVAISERARQMARDGHDVIALSTGEPDFATPKFIIDATSKALHGGQTKYPPTAGTPALREAVAEEHGRQATEVIISTGAKQVLANALLATLNPGDEVLLPTPYWSSYADMVRLAEGSPVEVPCPMAAGFKLSAQALETAVTPRTRWLILNSPSNPTGSVYSALEIGALAEVLERNPHVWVISDEIYEHLSFINFVSFTAAAPQLASRTLTVSGVSKAWAMTGWRIGWGVGPAHLISAMVAVQGQTTSGAATGSQAGALAALQGPRGFLDERREAYRARRDKVVKALNAMPGIECAKPDGAFYVFPSCSAALKTGETDGDFCGRVLAEAGVALVPGRAFGMPGHFRLSFAYSDDALDDGLARLGDYLQGETI